MTQARALPELILRAAREYALWRPGARVVVGVSGGPDSVALLGALTELPAPWRPELAAANLDHGLRPGAAAEAQTVARVAADLGIAFYHGAADVAASARARGGGVEAAGRAERYAFLAQSAARFGARVVAVGHHRDDQAETVLLRLLRGAGSRGLSAMRPRRVLLGPDGFRGWLVRPLWFADRATVLAYLQMRGLPWHADETNADLGPARNRIRHEILPLLDRQFGPDVRRALARAADHLCAEDEALRRWAVRAGARHRRSAGVDVGQGWAHLPWAVRARVLQAWWEAQSGLPSISSALLAGLDTLAPGASLDLPGGRRAHRHGDLLTMSQRRTDVVPPVALAVPGQTPIPGMGLVTAHVVDWPDTVVLERLRTDRRTAAGDFAGVRPPLALRAPEPGERVQVEGLAGQRPVRELLREAGVPRPARRSLPWIVSDASGRVLWIAGARPAAGFHVGERTRRALVLGLQPEDRFGGRAPASLS